MPPSPRSIMSPKSSNVGVLRMVDVADLRRDDLGARRAGEVQELVGLVRRDVAEDAAVPRASKNHAGRVLEVHAVRPEPDGLHDAADRARLDQLAGLDRGAVLEPLAVHDRVDAARLRLHPAHLGELLERGDARLVGHVVLAVLHHADAERRALVRDGGAEHELDGAVLEDLVLLRASLACGNRLTNAATRSGSFA